MIPVHLTTLLLLPGHQMQNPECPEKISTTDGFDWLENEALCYYSVDRNKMLKDLEDIKVDKNGKLLETIFAITGFEEIPEDVISSEDPRSLVWLRDSMDEVFFRDSVGEANMRAIYEDAKKMVDKVTYP